MNILFINSIRSDRYGGGEKWMLSAARGLKKRGHCIFIAGKPEGIFIAEAEKSNLSTWTINMPSDFSPSSSLKIHNFLKKNKIDTIICNYNRDIRVAGIAAAFAGVKNVYARHGLQIISNRIRYTLPLKIFTKGIITNTKTIKETYLQYNHFSKDFIHVLHNGIAVDESIIPEDYSNTFKDKTIVVAAGRLVKQKGFSDLINAAKIIAKKRKDIIFLVYGEGGLEKSLKHQIEKNGLGSIFFLKGFISPLASFIKGADIFILPSLAEGMPNVVMEAMALGTPVIATRVNGVPELVENNRSGIIIEPQNIVQMADVLEYLADHPEKRQALAKNAQKRIESMFTMEKMLEKLEKILERV